MAPQPQYLNSSLRGQLSRDVARRLPGLNLRPVPLLLIPPGAFGKVGICCHCLVALWLEKVDGLWDWVLQQSKCIY